MKGTYPDDDMATGDLVLLTGATGTVGFRIFTLLLEAGFCVRAVTRSRAGFDRIAALKPVTPYVARLDNVIVPDFARPHAFDEAVHDVVYAVHVASPVLDRNICPGDFEYFFVEPAVKGTIGILQSLVKTTSIRRVVLTGTLSSTYTPSKLWRPSSSGQLNILNGTLIGLYQNSKLNTRSPESSATVNFPRPWTNAGQAYVAAKVEAFHAANQFMAAKNPFFDVVIIWPSLIIGRDETITDLSGFQADAPHMIINFASGLNRAMDLFAHSTVHLDDVAKMHLLALQPHIQGNQVFVAASDSLQPSQWPRLTEIIEKRYPKQCAQGIFNPRRSKPVLPFCICADSSKAQKTFDIRFKTFEEQIYSFLDHYIEFIDSK